MSDVFIASDNIFSPLGVTTAENFVKLTDNNSGIKQQRNATMSAEPFYAALFDSRISFMQDANNVSYTKFEQLLIASIQDALKNCGLDTGNKKTVLIISSTKGNISMLETEKYNPALIKRIALHHSAKLITEYFQFKNAPLVVTNACISGLLGLITAMRLIRSGLYENAVVAGADLISKFVLSGFQSFQAISAMPCKPFDADRDGINLGEGAATIILSSNRKYEQGIKITGGATGNDANHISGPSRTGIELSHVMIKAIQDADLTAADINFISAHGTATTYNDEMEAKAISLANLHTVPVNSLKGFYGHTLGAAGLIESIVTIQSMKENLILPSKGFQQLGVSKPINVCDTLQHISLKNCLKSASGFGGCNAAAVFSKS